MARLVRVVVPGVPHHVTQRGNRRQETFFNADDYEAYLVLPSEWCGRLERRHFWTVSKRNPDVSSARPGRAASQNEGRNEYTVPSSSTLATDIHKR